MSFLTTYFAGGSNIYAIGTKRYAEFKKLCEK
jgi:hypothetical protein